LHITVARTLSWTVSSEVIASPITTESVIEDNIVISKVVTTAVLAKLKEGIGFAPISRVGIARGDISGDGRTSPEPGFDANSGIPKMGIYPTLSVVEPSSISVGLTWDNAAALVGPLVRGVNVAVISRVVLRSSAPFASELRTIFVRHITIIAGV